MSIAPPQPAGTIAMEGSLQHLLWRGKSIPVPHQRMEHSFPTEPICEPDIHVLQLD